MISVGQAVGYLLLDTTGFQEGISKSLDNLKVFQNESATVADKFSAVGSTLTGVGSTLTKNVTTPLVGVGTYALKTATDFEQAANQIESSTGASKEEMQKFEEVMRSIYNNNYGESYEDIANAISEVRKQMGELSSNELQNVTESAIAFRDTFGYEIPESVRSANTLMEQFGISSEEAFDLMAYGIQNGLDYSGELLDSINEYSVQFKKAGFDAENMFAAFVKGAENGAFNLDKVGDAVKEFSIRMVDGSDTTYNALKDLGLNTDEVIAKFAEGGESANSVFKEIITKLEEMPDKVKQNEVGVGLFGTMWEDLGADAVLSLNDIEDGLDGVKGTMDSIKEVKYDDLGSMLESLKRQFSDLALSIGNVLLPVIEPIIQKITEFVSSLTEVDQGVLQVIVSIGLVAAALGPLLVSIGSVVSAVSSLIPLISGLSAPILAVIAVVAALAAAWATDFGGIRESTQEIVTTVTDLISSFISALVSLWENDFAGIQTITQKVWDAIETIFSDVLGIITGLVKAFSALLQGDWSALWEAVKSIAQSAWDLICDLIGNALGLVISLFANAVAGVITAATSFFNGIYEAWLNVWNNYIKPVLFATPEEISNTLRSGASALFNAGVDLFNSFLDGLKSVWDTITSWVTDSLNWITGKTSEAQSAASSIDAASRSRGASAGGKPEGSYATGLDYVPRDMTVRVHEGERILTKQENQNYGKTVAARLYMNLNFTQPVDSNTAKKVSREIAKETEKELRSKGVSLV